MERYCNDFKETMYDLTAGVVAGTILDLLRIKFTISPKEGSTETKTETGIDCAALNNALLNGSIRVVQSVDGKYAFVPGEKKSDHDIMFENCMNNAERKMKEIETEHYFKAGGRNAGRCFGGISTYEALEAAQRISVLLQRKNKGCYVKSDETEKEQWDRLTGHQKCMKAAADAAYELQKKNETMALDDAIKYREEKVKENCSRSGEEYKRLAAWLKELKTRRSIISSGCISIEKDKNGEYKYSDKTQEIIKMLEELENKMKLIEKREAEYVDFILSIDSLNRRIGSLEKKSKKENVVITNVGIIK